MPPKHRLAFAYALSGLLAALLLASSVVGLLYGRVGFYGDYPAALAGLLGQDGLTLAFTTALGAWWAGDIGRFDAFLFVLFALMAIGAVLLLVTFLHSIGERGGRANPG